MKLVTVAAFRAAFAAGAVLALTAGQAADRAARLRKREEPSPFPDTALYEVLAPVEFCRAEEIGVPAESLAAPVMREILAPSDSKKAKAVAAEEAKRIAAAEEGARRRAEAEAKAAAETAAANRNAFKGPQQLAQIGGDGAGGDEVRNPPKLA